MTEDEGEVDADNEGAAVEAAEAADPFPGRDEAANADEGDYVDINDVEANGNIGEGGVFTRWVVLRRLRRERPQQLRQLHGRAGQAERRPARPRLRRQRDAPTRTRTTTRSSRPATSCVNGDQSTFFWPVLRDINGPSPDEGEDGGSLDGNVGSILKPAVGAADLPRSRRRAGRADAHAPHDDHGERQAGCAERRERQRQVHLLRAATRTGSPSSTRSAVAGGQLMRLLDYPSCWDGENLESKNFRDHMAFPDDEGNCSDGFTADPGAADHADLRPARGPDVPDRQLPERAARPEDRPLRLREPGQPGRRTTRVRRASTRTGPARTCRSDRVAPPHDPRGAVPVISTITAGGPSRSCARRHTVGGRRRPALTGVRATG